MKAATTTDEAIRTRISKSFNTSRHHRNAGHNGAMTAVQFIGRDNELQRLGALLHKAADGAATTAVVAGEAGAGKSRLLARFTAQARDTHGAHVLQGSCINLGGGLIPYAPLVEALRLLIREWGEERTRAAAGPGWDDLAPLISVFTGIPSGNEHVSGQPGRLHVLGAVLRMLEYLGRSAPVVLVFEDMHWADQSTLDLVAYLARTMSTERTLLVCSHRSELPAGHALRVLLAEPDFGRRVQSLEVPSFTELELRSFLKELTPLDRDMARRCYELSGGNAFFAEQLVVSGALTNTGPGTPRVPESVNELMLARIAVLNAPAKKVLQVAAAAARRLDDRLLEAVCELPADVLDGALHECREQGMIVIDPNGDAYAVRHALLSEAVYHQMGLGERRRLHTRMAEAMTADVALGLAQEWGIAVESAHHWYHAERHPEALAAAVHAGEATMRVRAFHEAEKQYGRVLDALWSCVPDPERSAGRTREQLLAAGAEASRWAGHVSQAVERVEEAICILTTQAHPGRLGLLYERLGSYQWEAGETETAQSAYAEAVRLLAEAAPDEAAYARALVGLAMAEIRSGSYSPALARAQQAVELARTCGDVSAEGRALNAAGLALALLGRAGEGEPLLREAVDIADRTDHLEDLLRAYGNLTVALELAGDLTGWVDAARAGLRRAQALGLTDTRLGIVLANNAGVALTLLGRWDEATTMLEEVLLSRPRIEQSAFLRLTLAEVHVARGRNAEAEELIGEVRKGHIVDPRFVSAMYACEAELWCWQEQPDRALEAVLGGLATVADTENTLVRLRLCSVGLRAAADRFSAAPQDAGTLGADLLATARRAAEAQPGNAEARVHLWMCEAEHRRLVGEDPGTIWSDVATDSEKRGLPYQTAYARWRQASVGRDVDREAAAWAYETATRLGAVPLQAAVAKLTGDPFLQKPDTAHARDAAVRPAATAQTLKDLGLTPREIEVYQLLAANPQSNRELAKRLFIAEGTVATHIHRITRKLGVESRTEAVALAYTSGWFVEHPASTSD